MNIAIHFEIPVQDMERAIRFYEGVFETVLERVQIDGNEMALFPLESGTAGLKVPTGEVRDFPTNTSDALMSGGADAIAGAIERSMRRLRVQCGAEPLLIMSGGAVSRLSHVHELPTRVVENLIFEGLLTLAASSGAGASAS